jgi:hypothetical protein
MFFEMLAVTSPHGAVSHKMEVFMDTAARSWNARFADGIRMIVDALSTFVIIKVF